MSEPTAPDAFSSSGAQAGALLREARQAQGLDIDSVAAMIKVTPAKLEALELGRYDQLPDANFTRALAMTVCRSLKIDPAPVLAALPAAKAIPLGPNKPALNQPFKESRGANLTFDSGQSFDVKTLLRPQWLAPIVLLLASVVVYFLPETIQWPQWPTSASKPAPEVASVPSVAQPSAPEVAASEPLTSTSAPEIVPSHAESASAAAAAESVPLAFQPEAASLAPTSPVPSAASVPVASSGNPLVLTSRAPAWVEVRDGRGGILLSRHLKAGETVDLAGVPPLKLRIGNSSGLDVVYQGQPVDLASYTRNNVARLELK